jgi:hypothetical protein
MTLIRNPWSLLLDEWPAVEAIAAFKFVQMASDGVRAAATAGQRGVIGVSQNAPAMGEICLIAGGGQTQVVAGVAVAKGDALMSDASGRAITAAATTSNHVHGYALEAASGAGVVFRMAFGYRGPVTNNA